LLKKTKLELFTDLCSKLQIPDPHGAKTHTEALSTRRQYGENKKCSVLGENKEIVLSHRFSL